MGKLESLFLPQWELLIEKLSPVLLEERPVGESGELGVVGKLGEKIDTGDEIGLGTLNAWDSVISNFLSHSALN